jgi:hypothetical protein
MEKFILVHKEDGVYVGNALGLGFWSRLDAADQESAVTFDSEQEAKDHVASWDCSDELKNAVTFQPVETSERYIHKSLLTQYW